jgi:hypothetical protein
MYQILCCLENSFNFFILFRHHNKNCSYIIQSSFLQHISAHWVIIRYLNCLHKPSLVCLYSYTGHTYSVTQKYNFSSCFKFFVNIPVFKHRTVRNVILFSREYTWIHDRNISFAVFLYRIYGLKLRSAQKRIFNFFYLRHQHPLNFSQKYRKPAGTNSLFEGGYKH